MLDSKPSESEPSSESELESKPHGIGRILRELGLLGRSLTSPRMALCILTGFSSGMPLWVLEQLIPTWLRAEHIDLASISWLSLVALPYTLKPLWAPFLDSYTPPLLGRRRGWALIAQAVLLPAIAALSALEPGTDLAAVGALMSVIAFASASQDIVLDAYRREILPDVELGLGNSVFVQAYRLSSLVPGALGLIVAEQASWSVAHLVVASFMAVGLLTSWCMPESAAAAAPRERPRPLRADFFWTHVVGPLRAPFSEFLERNGVRHACAILAFLLLYKLGDSLATALASPFYLDVGFTPTQIGVIVKTTSLVASIAGGLLGGVMMLRLGIDRSLWIFGALQCVSILGFAWLARAGPDPWVLRIVVGFEYLGVGLGTAAFVAFLARATRPPHTAAQIALFTAMTAIPRTLVKSTSGTIVEAIGYFDYFLLCAVLALPGLLLLPYVAAWPRRATALSGARVEQGGEQ